MIKEAISVLKPPTFLTLDSFDPSVHIQGALDWIAYAHAQTHDGGISKGYDLLRQKWAFSYPETTGYTIPTLLNSAEYLQQPALKTFAFSLADYLLACRTPEGGVAHWQAGETPEPVVFDTGQVMFGWLAAFEASGDERYLEAAIQAGDWLAAVQDEAGCWRAYQHLGVPKVIDTRVSWALLRLYGITQREHYLQTAVKNLDWTLLQQEEDGWFNHCAFLETEDPFTHTLAYTAEGLYECGRLLAEERYLHAGRLTAAALLKLQYDDGHLASTYSKGWQESHRSSCLTGNCQMARLWLRIFDAYRDEAYLRAAEKAILYVAGLQKLGDYHPGLRGGVAGSYPIYGRYERFKYPNWAAKFFIDALLTLDLWRKTQNSGLIFVG